MLFSIAKRILSAVYSILYFLPKFLITDTSPGLIFSFFFDLKKHYHQAIYLCKENMFLNYIALVQAWVFFSLLLKFFIFGKKLIQTV